MIPLGASRRHGADPRAHILPMACALLVLPAILAVAQEPAAPAGLDWVFAEAERIAQSLERLRFTTPPEPKDIAEIVAQSQAMLKKADRDVAEYIRVLTAAAKNSKKPRRDRWSAVRCRLAVEKADLHRLAAAAMPDGHPMRKKMLNDAIGVYRELRIEFRDSAPGLSLMGYVGECRAQRLADNVEAAHKALNPLRQVLADMSGRGKIELRRLLKLEELETTLIAYPSEAVKRAKA